MPQTNHEASNASEPQMNPSLIKKTKKQILEDHFKEQDVMKFGDDGDSIEDASP